MVANNSKLTRFTALHLWNPAEPLPDQSNISHQKQSSVSLQVPTSLPRAFLDFLGFLQRLLLIRLESYVWSYYVWLDELWEIDWLIEQGLTSPPTHYRLYGRRFFTGLKTQPTVSKYWWNTEITQLTEKCNNDTKNTKHSKSPSLQ